MPSARPGRTERERQASADQAARSAARLMDYRATFSSASGQRVLAHLLENCRVLYPSPDPFTEGKRAVGLHIVEMLTREADDLTQFIITANTERLFHE